MADLKAVSARTAQAKWHRALGLTVPEDLGKAVRFKVTDANGEVLTSLLLGKKKLARRKPRNVKTYGLEQRHSYVRREDASQSWLARGRLPRNPNMAAWMSQELPRGDADALQSVSFGKSDKVVMTRVTADSWSLAAGEGWLAGFQP